MFFLCFSISFPGFKAKVLNALRVSGCPPWFGCVWEQASGSDGSLYGALHRQEGRAEIPALSLQGQSFLEATQEILNFFLFFRYSCESVL